MKKTKPSYIIIVLKRLLAGETLTASSISGHNANQYFCAIKNNGIELVEVRKPNLTNTGRHKERSLYQTPENIVRAKKYLDTLKGVKPKKDIDLSMMPKLEID